VHPNKFLNIKSQLEFQRIFGSGGDVLMAVNNLYKAIREDIGLSNAGLNNLEYTQEFLINFYFLFSMGFFHPS
jgi:hypothetical protein